MFQSAASNGHVMVAATSGGALVVSADQGATWQRRALPVANSIVALTHCADGSFVGLDYYRRIWLGDAEGRTWQSRPITGADNPMATTCDAAGRIWVVGGRTRILSSSDRGAHWTSRQAGEDAILTTVQFLDAQHGHVTGEFGLHLATDDGGATWKKQPKLAADFYPYATVFASDREGWSAGVAGVLLHTADGGASWQVQPNRSDAPIYALAAIDGTVYGAGFGGQMVVLRGGEWLPYDHGKAIPGYLAAIAAHGAPSLLVAGAAGALHLITPALPGAVAAKQ
ncbi:MAG: hypothetical protein KGN16_19655 [Burkholderiales bacterium]|nr:hypothetical protein [Burkholderiales bacterium]